MLALTPIPRISLRRSCSTQVRRCRNVAPRCVLSQPPNSSKNNPSHSIRSQTPLQKQLSTGMDTTEYIRICNSEDGIVENCAVEELYICSLGVDGNPGCIPLHVVDQTAQDLAKQLEKTGNFPWTMFDDNCNEDSRFHLSHHVMREFYESRNEEDSHDNGMVTLIQKARVLWKAKGDQEKVRQLFEDEIRQLYSNDVKDPHELDIKEALVMGQHALFLWELEEEEAAKNEDHRGD